MKKDWRERELTLEVIVGAFVVMIFLGLGYFTIILSTETWFSEKTAMQVSFSNVMGLRDGDSVVVRGMPIGKVQSLALTEVEGCNGVCVNLLLDKPITIHKGYEMKIVATSILGGRRLQIDTGGMNAPVLDRQMYRGKDPYDLMEDAADIVNAVREEIVEGGVLRNIRETTDQLNTIVSRINAGEGILGKMISGKGTLYEDIAKSAASLRVVMTRLEKGESSMGKLLAADTKLYDDLSATVASLRTTLNRIEAGKGTVGRLLSDDETVYEDLAATVASLRNIAERIDSGEGTIGRFVQDDGLYTEVESTVEEVRAAVDDFRETAPVTTFSSVFFGAF